MEETTLAPRVSVIIVFLDAERFIEEAIRSVFRQTYRDWELLLVDDGSSDGSAAIALRYGCDNPGRVRYISHPGHENRGAAAARNLGVREARGEYIAFLDADDVYLPRKLEEQVALLDAHRDAAMLYGRTRLWYSWDGDSANAGRDAMTNPSPELDRLIEPPTLVTAHLRDEHIYPTTCSVLIRKDVINALGGFEESFRDTYEDMTLFMKILLEHPVYVAGRCWDWYRKHPASTWARAQQSGAYLAGRPHPAREKFLHWLESHLRSRGDTNGEVWASLSKELRPYRHPTAYKPLSATKGAAQRLARWLEPLARDWVPIPVRDLVRHRLRRRPAPPVGWVRFGSLRRVTPISTYFGFDRGGPIDRYYIESFLERHAADVRGRVLEVEEDTYTRRFGGARVEQADVLYLVEGNPQATIIADLTDAEHIPTDSFDCVILTQTLQYIYDCRAAVRTLFRILKPGGVVLATFPGIIQLDDDDSGASSQWSFTPLSARRVFEEAFPPEHVEVEAFGNVLAAIAFLHGIAQQELRKKELDYHDPCYVVTNAVRAVKPPVSQP